MVERDLIARGIVDPAIVAAFNLVPRHLFVTPNLRYQAYHPVALPIEGQQSISQPYIVALMLSKMGLTAQSKVLDVGCGSGYQAALLSRICKQVYAVERIPGLVHLAKQRLAQLNYHNVVVKLGDGFEGWPEFAPYDAIVVAACADSFPEALYAQLKEGGHLVLPMREGQQQMLYLYVKRAIKPKRVALGPCVFVPFVKAP